MADDEEDNTDLPPPSFTPEQQAYVAKIAAKARAQGRGERAAGKAGGGSPAPKADAQPAADDIASIVSRTVAETMKAMQQPTNAPPAAAPSAPAASATPTLNGLVDYFSLSIDQINELGPEGIRDLHERALKVGSRGAPPRPQAPNSRRR
jgi:hypothetical protein